MTHAIDILTDAFNRQTLCLHIDQQNKYTTKANAQVFQNVFALSADLRALNIPNYWVVYNDEKQADWMTPFEARFFASNRFAAPGNQTYKLTHMPPPHEIVLPKTTSGLFDKKDPRYMGLVSDLPHSYRQQSHHRDKYDPFALLTAKDKRNTFIIDGVSSVCCVPDTITGCFVEASETGTKLDIIVPAHCVDYSDMDRDKDTAIDKYIAYLHEQIRKKLTVQQFDDYVEGHLFGIEPKALVETLRTATLDAAA